MSTTTLRIKIGASADRSIEAVFGTMEQRSKRAARVIQQNLNAGMGKGGPYRSRPDAGYDAAARAAERSAKRQTTATENSVRDQMRALSKLGRFMESELNRQARAVQRAAEQQSRAAQRAQDRFATRTSYRATRFLFPPPSGMLGSARRFGSDMLRGAGVDFGLGSMVGRGVELQRAGINLSNQGYNPNDPRNAKRIESGVLTGEARAIGTKWGLDPAEIMRAHDAFVSLTGDLQTSRESMNELAKLSVATGTSITDMAEAQASVSLALGDVEGKSAKIESIMRAIAGQGKVGAVEIKDLAKGMAGIAANAPKFTGDVGKNIEMLGALAQLSRGTGGSKSAAQAVTAVERFTSTLETPARLKQFKAMGIDVYGKDNKIRDPFELIKESLVATKADPVKMNQLFANVMGKRGVTALQNAYTSAGGGKAGLDAVDREYKRFAKAAMERAQVEENAARAAASDAAKAQRFQNNLDEIASKLHSSLIPTLERMAPAALKVSEAFAKVVDWAAKNPGQAITAAIVASIARAGLESGARAALEAAIKSAFRGGLPVPTGGGSPTGAPVPGGAGMLPLALTTAAAGGGSWLAYDQGQKLLAESGASGFGNALDFIPGMKGGKFSSDQLIKEGLNKNEWIGKIMRSGSSIASLIDPDEISARQDYAAKGGLHRGIARGIAEGGARSTTVDFSAMGRSMADALRGTELRVRVTNTEDMKRTSVDPDGRTPNPGKPK